MILVAGGESERERDQCLKSGMELGVQEIYRNLDMLLRGLAPGGK